MSNTWIGRTLNGRYQIEELLGQGGMSAVYRATDPNLRRVVAVKLIHSHLSDSPDFMRRFEEEAASVARMRHNNIIQVFDFNHEDEAYYIVFEYIPGETLQAWLSRLNSESRFMPIEQALTIAAAVADALAYAHQRNLVHRDVKPANIIINVQGEPILMDFGIVKIVGGTQHTATGAVIGTARYMSPEQIRGEQVDARTDLYSLGVMLFEMLSGQPPYQSDSAMTILMMHIQDPVPNLLDLRPDAPPSVVQILNRALSKNPDDRYGSASEMAAALRQARAGLQKGKSPAAAVPAAGLPPAADTDTLVSPAPSTPPPAPVTHSAAGAATADTRRSRPTTAAGTERGGFKKWAAIGGALVFLLLVFGLGYTLWPSGNGDDTTTAASVAEVETAVAALAADDESETDSETADLEPTSTPFPEVVITNIALVSDVYVVQYNHIGFEETANGLHIHFFFDTIPQREAGRPFSDFYMYFGPSPYTELRLSDRPAAATQICAIVANPDHTVQGESGNCFDLPPTPSGAAQPSSSPRATAASATIYDAATTTAAATTAATATATATAASVSTATATPTATPSATPTPFVQISDISEENDVYIVNYTTTGFTEALPGVHIHFFFDTVAPENAGLPNSGPWFVWGGPRPFDGYTINDRPASAQRLCALVANSDHTVRPGTGNCVALPGSG